MAKMSRTQMRIQQITGSFGNTEGKIRDDIGALAMGSIKALDLSGSLGHMASAIKRIHGASSFSEAAEGEFSVSITPASNTGADLGSAAKGWDDLYLGDDGVIQLGNEQDVTLTHVPDTGVLLNGAMAIQFRDSAISIGSTADGDLSIAADDEIDITSTLIDINGNVDISGTTLATGVLTTTAIQVVNGGLAYDSNKKAQFRDAAIYINSSADGQLDIVADAEIQIAATNIDINGAADISGNLVVGGNLTVSGDTVQVDVTKLTVEDPIIELARGNTGGDTLDLGFFGRYNDGSNNLSAGLFRDTDDGKFHLFKDSQEDLSDATVVNTGAAGYAKADLIVNSLDADGGITIDNITIDGTEIDLSSGDLTLDVDGDIILDADGDQISLKFGGNVGQLDFSNANSGDVIVQSKVDSKDLVFQQFDGNEIMRLKDNLSVEVKDNLSLIGNKKELRFYEGINYVGFEAPDLGANQIWVLPNADGTVDQALKTDSNGNLSWKTFMSPDDFKKSQVQLTAALAAGQRLDTATPSVFCNSLLPDAKDLFNRSEVYVNGQLLMSGSEANRAANPPTVDYHMELIPLASATVQFGVADGDAANGMSKGDKISITSADQTKKEYIVTDTANGGGATGTVINDNTNLGGGDSLLSLGEDLAAGFTGVAIGLELAAGSATQNAFLVQLKAAIEHANGHNGKVIVGSVPNQANGNQQITLTQQVQGPSGNTAGTHSISNAIVNGASSANVNFANGVDQGISPKLSFDLEADDVVTIVSR